MTRNACIGPSAHFVIALIATALPVQAQGLYDPGGDGPMYYLRTFGSPGNEIAEIVSGLAWLSTAVVLIIAALVVGGFAFRARRVADMRTDSGSVDRSHDEKALRWIYAGLIVTLGALAYFTTWTIGTLAAIQAPDEDPALTVEITGHQWWWEVLYISEDGSRIFETANEVRVPVGQPVKLVLRSADVIHSFWVPLIGGKTDLIPGQDNTAWLRADVSGVYRGQCVEYCGQQHAHMALVLVAEPAEDFTVWLDRQFEPAAPDPERAR